jgi:hypothetical protein
MKWVFLGFLQSGGSSGGEQALREALLANGIICRYVVCQSKRIVERIGATGWIDQLFEELTYSTKVGRGADTGQLAAAQLCLPAIPGIRVWSVAVVAVVMEQMSRPHCEQQVYRQRCDH